MKLVVFSLVVLFCLYGCNPRVQRMNYSTYKKDYWDCGVQVNKYMTITDTLVKVGEIKLGDCGSKTYTQEQSLGVLINEGCAVDADVVNIIEENSKDQWSRCYMCRAEFYVKKKPNSPTYEPEKQKMTNKEKSALIMSIVSFTLTIALIIVKIQ